MISTHLISRKPIEKSRFKVYFGLKGLNSNYVLRKLHRFYGRSHVVYP